MVKFSRYNNLLSRYAVPSLRKGMRPRGFRSALVARASYPIGRRIGSSLVSRRSAPLARNRPYRQGVSMSRFRPGGRGYSRRPFKRTRMSAAQKKYNQKIWKIANPSKMTNSIRSLDSGAISCLTNKVSYSELPFCSQSYVDIARAACDVFAEDGSVGPQIETTYPEASHLMNAVYTYTIRNNGNIPCYLEATWFSTNISSSGTPVAAWSTDVTRRDGDLGLTVNDYATNPCFNIREPLGPLPSVFKQTFRQTKTRNFKLGVGDSIVLKTSRYKAYRYSDIMTDANTSGDYIKGLTQFLVLRLAGPVAHSVADNSNVGTGQARLDYTLMKVHNWNTSPAQRAYKHMLYEATTTFDTFTDPEVGVPNAEMKEVDANPP